MYVGTNQKGIFWDIIIGMFNQNSENSPNLIWNFNFVHLQGMGEIFLKLMPTYYVFLHIEKNLQRKTLQLFYEKG